MRRALCQGLVLVVAALSAAAGLAAEADIAGSRDSFGLDRFPRSWIVDYQRDEALEPRQFVMSRVDRIRREMRIEDQLRQPGTLETVTYRIPDGVSVDAVVAHYAELLGSDVLFRCDGRGCGRSNDWANQIFEQAILYGPDAGQRYLALEWQGRLVAMYVIERGNQRVYAHLRFLEPEGSAGLTANALLVRRLAEQGWAAVDAVTPGSDGSIDAAGARVLGALAPSLARFAGQTLHLVCHVGGPSAEAALSASRRCAEQGAGLIGEGAEGAPATLQVRPFGAGAMLPRPNLPDARVELVITSTP